MLKFYLSIAMSLVIITAHAQKLRMYDANIIAVRYPSKALPEEFKTYQLSFIYPTSGLRAGDDNKHLSEYAQFSTLKR